MRVENRGLRKALKFSAPLLILVLLVLGRGFTVSEATAECHETTVECKGLPVNGCIGFQSVETDILDKNQCEVVEDIEERCLDLKQTTCEQNPDSGSQWMEISEVKGQKCGVWDSEYDMEMGAC